MYAIELTYTEYNKNNKTCREQ